MVFGSLARIRFCLLERHSPSAGYEQDGEGNTDIDPNVGNGNQEWGQQGYRDPLDKVDLRDAFAHVRRETRDAMFGCQRDEIGQDELKHDEAVSTKGIQRVKCIECPLTNGDHIHNVGIRYTELAYEED